MAKTFQYRFEILIGDSQRTELERVSKSLGMTASNFTRLAIADYLHRMTGHTTPDSITARVTLDVWRRQHAKAG